MSYPNQLVEFRLIAKRVSGLLSNADAINKISKLANVLRRLHAQKSVHTLLSTRSVIS